MTKGKKIRTKGVHNISLYTHHVLTGKKKPEYKKHTNELVKKRH